MGSHLERDSLSGMVVDAKLHSSAIEIKEPRRLFTMTLQSWLHQGNFTIARVKGVNLVRKVRCQNLKEL